jgi:hypothetical protein
LGDASYCDASSPLPCRCRCIWECGTLVMMTALAHEVRCR